MRTVATLLACILLTSCATIISGTGPDHVPISSTPPGATIVLDGVQVGVTPATIPVPRKGKGEIILKLEGHHDRLVQLDWSGNGAIVGNIIFGGLIGLIIDSASGASWSWKTRPCDVELAPISAPALATYTQPKPKRPVSERRKVGGM